MKSTVVLLGFLFAVCCGVFAIRYIDCMQDYEAQQGRVKRLLQERDTLEHQLHEIEVARQRAVGELDQLYYEMETLQAQYDARLQRLSKQLEQQSSQLTTLQSQREQDLLTATNEREQLIEAYTVEIEGLEAQHSKHLRQLDSLQQQVDYWMQKGTHEQRKQEMPALLKKDYPRRLLYITIGAGVLFFPILLLMIRNK